MTNAFKAEICDRIFAILLNGVPRLFEAENFVESQNRISPHPVFIESRDVLSHLRDIAANSLDVLNVDKNLIEIQEHIRRGIVETYQEHYEYLSSSVFNSYGKYKQSFIKFESLLGLRKKHAPLHSRIREVLKNSQDVWMEARNLKNNELTSLELERSIEKFKEAAGLVLLIETEVEIIFNNFYKRGIITSFVFLFTLAIFVIQLFWAI